MVSCHLKLGNVKGDPPRKPGDQGRARVADGGDEELKESRGDTASMVKFGRIITPGPMKTSSSIRTPFDP